MSPDPPRPGLHDTEPAPPPEPPLVLAIFPLTGCLLLPGNWLPLNVFEPRYRNLVEDVRLAARHIGMIQPFVPRQDNWPALDEPPDDPPLYRVGCAGRIERCEEQPDGRFLILLRGVTRFRVRRELAPERGYRRVEADYEEFAADAAEMQHTLDPTPVLAALEAFSQAHRLSFDLDMLAALPGISLVNGLAVALPFRPEEKQALLETAGPAERQELPLALMEMGIEPAPSAGTYAPPTLH